MFIYNEQRHFVLNKTLPNDRQVGGGIFLEDPCKKKIKQKKNKQKQTTHTQKDGDMRFMMTFGFAKSI
jgi:hypothetical protein